MDVHFLGRTGRGNIGHNIFILEKITERSVEATIKSLATKDDVESLGTHLRKRFNEVIWWMFFFAVANVCSTTIIFWWVLKK
jgi:hypothetical protein